MQIAKRGAERNKRNVTELTMQNCEYKNAGERDPGPNCGKMKTLEMTLDIIQPNYIKILP